MSIGVLGVHLAAAQAEALGPRARDSGRPRLGGRAPDSGRLRFEGGAEDSGRERGSGCLVAQSGPGTWYAAGAAT